MIEIEIVLVKWLLSASIKEKKCVNFSRNDKIFAVNY